MADTQKAGRTPGPWKVFGMGDIVARKPGTSTYLTVKHNWECAPEEEIPEREANAAFIVEAVNSHDALLAENKRLREALEDVFALMDEGLLVRDTTADSEPDWALRHLKFVQRLKKAHDALASRQEPDRG